MNDTNNDTQKVIDAIMTRTSILHKKDKWDAENAHFSLFYLFYISTWTKLFR